MSIVEINFFENQDLRHLNYSLDDIQEMFTSLPQVALQRIAEGGDDHNAFPVTIFYREKAAGFFVLDFGEDKFGLTENTDAVLLRALSLNPDFQGKGIAKNAMLMLDDFVKLNFQSCNEIVLAVNNKNQHAYRLYLKCGYKDDGKTRPFHDGFQHILTKKME